MFILYFAVGIVGIALQVARADHAAVSFGNNSDRCLIFGGKCKDTYLDDLIVIKNINSFPINESEQQIYKEVSLNNNNNKHPNSSKECYTQSPLKIESIHLPKGPCGRRGSSLCPWKDGSFLLFGGQRFVCVILLMCALLRL